MFVAREVCPSRVLPAETMSSLWGLYHENVAQEQALQARPHQHPRNHRTGRVGVQLFRDNYAQGAPTSIFTLFTGTSFCKAWVDCAHARICYVGGSQRRGADQGYDWLHDACGQSTDGYVFRVR